MLRVLFITLCVAILFGMLPSRASAQCPNCPGGKCVVPVYGGPTVKEYSTLSACGRTLKSTDGNTYYRHPDGVYRKAYPTCGCGHGCWCAVGERCSCGLDCKCPDCPGKK